MTLTQNTPCRARRTAAWILIVAVLHPSVILAQGPSAPAEAPPSVNALREDVDTGTSAVHLVPGRSTVLDVGTPITRVSLTSADIADALVTSSTQLLIHGKAPGTISLFVWERSGAVRRFEVIVGRDVEKLATQLKQLFPNEAVTVTSNGRDVVLSGAVAKKETADQIINVSTGFVDRKEDVVSLLRVQNAPSNQVLLKVRFAEVSRSAMTELGASFFTGPGGFEGWIGRTTTQQFSAPDFDREGLEFSDFLNLFVFNIRNDLGAVIRALQTRGLFQSLAEPNLVAESGKEASFLAGGEFPIPVTQPGGGNAITVQFKEFGVRLNFIPTVTGDRVHLRVRPEVSTLDFANGVNLQGFRIPALISRRTETELELRDGQTFAIAGLLNNQLATTMQKIPGIGDIPILGLLFRSKAASKERTELVVMITPHILPEGSFGVTREVPRIREPFLEPFRQNETMVPPPPPFPPFDGAQGAPSVSRGAQPGVPSGNAGVVSAEPAPAAGSAAPAAPLDAARGVPSESRGTAAVMSAPGARAPSLSGTPNLEPGTRPLDVAPAAPPKPTAAERRAAEREAAQARREAEERAKAEARAAKAKAEEDRRLQRIEAEAQKAEAERQKKAAQEQAKRDAEEARRKAAEERRAAEEARRNEEEERKRQAAIDAAAAKVRAAEAAYQAEVARSSRQ